MYNNWQSLLDVASHCCFLDQESLKSLPKTVPQFWDTPLPSPDTPYLLRLHFTCGQCWGLKGWERGRDWYLSLVFVQRSQRKEPLNLQHKRTSSFLSPYSQKNKLPLTPPKPSLLDKSTGRELSCRDSLHRPTPTHPLGQEAQPLLSCLWEEPLRAETRPKFFRGMNCQIRGQTYFFFLLIVKIKLKQSKRKIPSCISLKALTLPFDFTLSFPTHILNCLLFLPPKGLKWPIGIYSTHWNFLNGEVKERKNVI